MIDVSSRQLRAFVLVADHRSFSRAAEALFITPSGLSVMIREMEHQLGFRLFDRTTRHVALTTHGNGLLAVARQMLHEWDSATARIERTAREASTTLSVGAGLLMAANILPDAIQEFRGRRPDVRVQLFDAGPAAILKRVQAGTLDMGLGFFTPTPGVRRIPFFRFSLMAVRRETSPDSRRNSVTWSSLRTDQLILQASPAPTRQVIEERLAAAGVDSRRAISVNRLETVIAMVEAGAGVAVVPSFATPVCRRRGVTMTRLANPVVPIDFFQIRNRGRKLGPAAEVFSTFLQGYIARWAGRAGIL